MRHRLPGIVMFVLAAVLVLPPVSNGWGEGVAWAAPQDPPARVGRLNYISGSVSFAPPGVNEWAPATVNYPLTSGASLWTDEQARAEFHVGSTVFRMNQSTALEFLNLDDNAVQLRMSQGTINVVLHHVAAAERYEVDTPTAAISLLHTGIYRIDVSTDGTSVQVTVHSGDAEIAASTHDFHVYAGQAAVISGSESNLSYDIRPTASSDAFDQWAMAREHQEQIALQGARYVSSGMTGFEDLTQFGTWRVVPDFGPVWIPAVQEGWAPFRFGRWVWVQPWGWTWVAAEPWGFAPFHFGRWVLIGGVWGWVPGVVVVQPVFAPALVVFVVVGDFIGWFPLAPSEVFIPSFAASPAFIQRININLININITNVTVINRIRERKVFVFQQVPGAVTVVHKTVFINADSVGRSHVDLTGPVVGRTRVVGTTAPVAPTVHSVLGRMDPAPMVAKPPAVVLQRTVVVRQTPPPGPVPFNVQQKLLTANQGRPLDPETVARLREQVRLTRPLVKPVGASGPREPALAPPPTPTTLPLQTLHPMRPEPRPTPQPMPMPHPAPAPHPLLPVLHPVNSQPVSRPQLQQAPMLHPVVAPRPESTVRPKPMPHPNVVTPPPHGPQLNPVRQATPRPRPTPNCDPHSRYYDRSRCPKQTH